MAANFKQKEERIEQEKDEMLRIKDKQINDLKTQYD
jgi:hypothetical protein